MSLIRMCLHKQHEPVALIVLLSALIVTAARAADQVTIRISPDTQAIPEMGVPFLHEKIAEHQLSGNGLILTPHESPYQWTKIGPTNEPFILNTAVDATHFTHGILTIWNWHNFAVHQSKILAGTDAPIEVFVDGLGTYLITLDGYRDGVCQKRLIRNIAVTRDSNTAREFWKKDEFFIGLCAFPGRYHWTPGGFPTLPSGLTEEEARHHEAELIARLGLQVVRVDESIEMGRKQRDGKETYYFDFARMDAATSAWTSRGFELALQSMSSADWAVLPQYADQGKKRWRYPHQEAPQRAYLAALVNRYRKHSRFLQISNEPDQIGYWSGTNQEFVTQFTFSQDEVRRVAPDLPITYGGFTVVDEAKCAYFLKHIHHLADFPAYNAHGNLTDYARSFATMRRLQQDADDHANRWVNTETGYSAWRLEQERRQGQIDAQKILYSWANDHAGVLLFCSRMTRGPGRDGTPDFGLLDYQFCPRFVYGSVAALTTTLAGASFESTLSETDAAHLYTYRRGMDLIVAGFTLEDSATVQIASDAKDVISVDEMGNVRQMDSSTGLKLSLDGYPRYWVLKGASRVQVD
jgi:hypothetical protein